MPRWQAILLGLAAAFLLAAPALFGSFTITLMNYIGVYSLATLGLVLLTGVGGLTSFGQAAFVGIGAYATAWYTAVYGGSPWIGLLLSLALTGIVATTLGAATLRLGGHFLPLSTIAWAIAIFFLFGNIEGLGHYGGISGIPPISLGTLSLRSTTANYYFIWATLGLAMLLCANLLDSRQGRAIRSLRGGIAMVESLAINSFLMRLAVFVLAGLLAGLAGWLYAHMQRFVSPAPFDIRPGIELLLAALVGGAGHILGAVVGATVIMLLKNALQDILPTFSRHSGQLEIVFFGALFIVLLQHARAGIVPKILQYFPRAARPLPTQAPPLARRSGVPAATTLLTVERAVKRFGGLIAVNEVSFEVKSGEILGLIGPNGAGKSTLLNLITGTLKPSAGRFVFRSEEITHLPARKIAAGMARTFQHVKLRPNMTLIDNVLLGTYLRTRTGFLAGALRLDRTEENSARLEALRQLQRVGLGGKTDELAGNLPLGQQRVLELARALAADPLVVILDEPAAGLRRLEKQALSDLLRTLRGEGLTVVLVEHDMEFVMNLVDRIVVMDFGAKLAEGLPAQIRADARVQEAYLGGVGMSALLSVDDLHVSYGKVEAVAGVSLQLGVGQIVTVIGPNGAGKTTLLAALIGLLPSREKIRHEGVDLGPLRTEERVRRGICLVPERRELFGEMTVDDNLILGAYTRWSNRTQVARDLIEVYGRFPQLADRRRQLAGTLSGGERQMLALGRALMAKPRLLLLDEPSLGLAPLIVREIFRIVMGLRELGVSILLVEQNARAALETADFGYVLETGEIVHSGPAAELIHDPKVIASYLGGKVDA